MAGKQVNCNNQSLPSFSNVEISEFRAANLRIVDVMLGKAVQQYGIGPGLESQTSFHILISTKLGQDQKVNSQSRLLPVHVPIKAHRTVG
jgi:hypothetical protein